LAALGVVAAAQAQVTETVLHSFPSYSPNGASPFAGVIRDAAGNLYGTSTAGGAANAGVVYKVDAAGKETVLYSFTGGADGGKPQGGVILDTAGNLYGTTPAGGAANAGVVYKVDTAGTETVLHSFTGKYDGGTPYAGLIRDAAGNLYGTTYDGGPYRAGVLFMLDTAGHEKVLYSFMGGADGSHPTAGVVRDAAGNFYGTTAYGGTGLARCAHPPAGCGVVYRVDPSGQETLLHTFTAESDGAEPDGGVILDAQGNLYGTTYSGGNGGYGTVFKIDVAGHETILYSFMGGTDAANPQAGVIADASGNLYGTTYYGGPGGGGVVYKLDTAGHETVLHSFKSYAPGPDGFFPTAGVILDPAGNLYGTTQSGGPAQFGLLFKLDAAGQETILNCFTGGAGGHSPQGGVMRDEAGNLYGTTYYGGAANAGVVFKTDAAGREKVLYISRAARTAATPTENLFGTQPATFTESLSTAARGLLISRLAGWCIRSTRLLMRLCSTRFLLTRIPSRAWPETPRATFTERLTRAAKTVVMDTLAAA